MEYFFAYVALAIFVGFILVRVRDARKDRGEGQGGSGGGHAGTGRYEEK